MDSATQQARALQDTVGIRTREDLLVYRLEGEDQRAWLNGQVTNDVRHTQKGDSVYCLSTTVKGRIVADVWVLDRGDALLLLVPASAAETLLASYESQIIMEDVAVVAEPQGRVISLLGPASAQLATEVDPDSVRIYPGDELGLGGLLLLTQEDACEGLVQRLQQAAAGLDGGLVSMEGFELARVRAGVPRFGRDFGSTEYPQEAGLKARAVSFNKGCYLGQEVVHTLENRGKLSRMLCALSLSTSVADGTDLHDESGQVVGRVTSVVEDGEAQSVLGLGYVKRGRAEPGTQLTAGAAQVTVVRPLAES